MKETLVLRVVDVIITITENKIYFPLIIIAWPIKGLKYRPEK